MSRYKAVYSLMVATVSTYTTVMNMAYIRVPVEGSKFMNRIQTYVNFTKYMGCLLLFKVTVLENVRILSDKKNILIDVYK